jgi:hypothetical protein
MTGSKTALTVTSAHDMAYELVAPDGSIVSAGVFTDADAKAPRGGLIERLATLIAAHESEDLGGRERVKWLPYGPERDAAAGIYGDSVVSDSWLYALEGLHGAFVARRDLPVLNGWSVRIRTDAVSQAANTVR